MAYASASDVAIICQSIMGNEEMFSTSTSPTLDAVERWISSGCATIETKLSGAGYDVPPASGTAVYQQLVDLNALYAAARVELSRSNVVLAPGARTRGQVFREMFWEELNMLCEADLTQAGLDASSDGTLFVGGISKDDKRSRKDDTDAVEPRFERGQFAFPGTLRREQLVSASQQ